MKRRIALPVAATLGFLALLTAAPAQALPSCGYTLKCVTTYYTDKTLSPQGVVGMRGVDCGNRTISWGVITPHSRYTTTSCGN